MDGKYIDLDDGELVKKISTGVIGLDELLYGGAPTNNQILISGDAGTGKTLLTFEILYRNAKINVPATFITTEERKDKLIENAKSAYTYFDDIDDLINNKVLQISEMQVLDVLKSRENWEAFIVGINRVVQANNSKLLVIDSLTPLRVLADDDRTFTRSINFMIENFRNMDITTFLTTETTPTAADPPGLYGTFMFDGMIFLSTVMVKSSFQYLMRIAKMRRTNHRNTAVPYEISAKGFNVFR